MCTELFNIGLEAGQMPLSVFRGRVDSPFADFSIYIRLRQPIGKHKLLSARWEDGLSKKIVIHLRSKEYVLY